MLAERFFRVFSLAFLTIGFVVGIAGADRDGVDHTISAIDDLVVDMHSAQEANEINQTPPEKAQSLHQTAQNQKSDGKIKK